MTYPTIHRTRIGNVAIVIVAMAATMGAGPGPVAAQDTLPSAEHLTARHVEAIGGRDAVLRPQATRFTGTFEMLAPGALPYPPPPVEDLWPSKRGIWRNGGQNRRSGSTARGPSRTARYGSAPLLRAIHLA